MMKLVAVQCPICFASIPLEDYDIDQEGNYWICSECGCDRVGVAKLLLAGHNPIEVHKELSGRERYSGINIISYPLILETYNFIREANSFLN